MPNGGEHSRSAAARIRLNAPHRQQRDGALRTTHLAQARRTHIDDTRPWPVLLGDVAQLLVDTAYLT